MAQTIRSSTSQTLVAALSTINSAATSVAKIIDSASSSVDMLDRYVQRAKTNQIAAHLVEDHTWKRNLIVNAGREQEKIETALHKDYANDPTRAQRFNAITSELEALFAPQQA